MSSQRIGRHGHKVNVKQHPGSTDSDVANEPDWAADDLHGHRIGYRNQNDRLPGITHTGDEGNQEEYDYRRRVPSLTSSSSASSDDDEKEDHSHEGDNKEQFLHRAGEEQEELGEAKNERRLLNFRDVVVYQEDYHLRYPEEFSQGWRYVLDVSEEGVKMGQDWPINVERKRKEEEAKRKEEEKEGREVDHEKDKKDEEKHQTKENDGAKVTGDSDKQETGYKEEGATEESKHSPQQRAMFEAFKHELEYYKTLKQNDGTMVSPVAHHSPLLTIDEADQFTPDNWIPRSSNMIRLTGNHPLNCEYSLTELFDAGLTTPNEFHYVRQHGAVPHLLWETHKLEISGLDGKVTSLSMDDIKTKWKPINIQVALACDGNRRKELNLLKRSKGFNWAAGGVSCSFWKGPSLRTVLLDCGIPEHYDPAKRYWLNIEGCDEPSEGKYATCIPFEHAMAETNDVILAYEMNNVPLPPDHGFPLRVVVPGWVGGRNVKWVGRIWVSEEENDSHYHIWDNRVVPSFITDIDDYAETAFRHPSSRADEQNLNSVVVKPAHGDTIDLSKAKDNTYKIEGYAYDGGGHEVQRVEVSLDGGETWLFCIRRFPDSPIRHGNKFWTWVFWHIEVPVTDLVRCKSIQCRAFNVFKNTQPEKPTWNIMGMMNNCWYRIKPEVTKDAELLFRHPVEPGNGDGGWMKPSPEILIAEAKQQSGTPEKQFTREEIEKHSSETDSWLVVNDSVYDVTSVVKWHPGGKAAILGLAGKLSYETTEQFNSIHDDYAHQKLRECVLGRITDKGKKYIAKTKADAATSSPAKTERAPRVQKHRWLPATLASREDVSPDTRKYVFHLPSWAPKLGIQTCQHIQLGFHLKDRMVTRAYTPTHPLCAEQEDGTFELVVKTYFPSAEQPGGAMSNILDCVPIGEEVEVKGPIGDITYLGGGEFEVEGKRRTWRNVTLILGGSGVTPGYALLEKVFGGRKGEEKGECGVKIRVIDCNKTEEDILLKEEMESLRKGKEEKFGLVHVLSEPSDEWKGVKGRVDKDIIREHAFPPDGGKSSVVFLCGPPGMIQHGALPALKEWGYVEEKDCFGF